MSVQLNYGFSTATGAPGGLFDLSPHLIDTHLNAEDTGVLKFGLGVVYGANPGVNIKKPTSMSTAADFVGIVTNNRTTEYDLEGKIHIRGNKAIGVLRYGRIYALLADGATPAYGDPVYLVVSGTDAGKFTDDSEDGIAIKGRFLSVADTATNVAVVELFNQAQVDGAAASAEPASISLNDLDDVTIDTATNGQVLKYDATNEVWTNGADATGV